MFSNSTFATGQSPGTKTNDSANAGNVGEYKSLVTKASNTTASITCTSATPAVVTWTTHGLSTGSAFYFTGTAPTGLVQLTTYYINVIDANTFNVATTLANLFAGTYVATSSTGSGLTGFAGTNMATATAIDVGGLNLTAGDWDVSGNVVFNAAAGTTVSDIRAWLSTSPASLPAVPLYQVEQTTFTTAGIQSLATPPTRVSLAATTPVSLSAYSAFAVSTLNGSGIIQAWRAR